MYVLVVIEIQRRLVLLCKSVPYIESITIKETPEVFYVVRVTDMIVLLVGCIRIVCRSSS